MKRFEFSLNKLMGYKKQVLDREKNDLAHLRRQQQQMLDEKSLYNEIKKLIKLRNENSALHNLSAFEFVSSDGYPLVYKRSSDNQTVYVFINPSDKAVTVNADYAKGGKAIYTLGENGSVKADTVTVPASGAIFVEV